MQEVVRKCDATVGKNANKCGERVPNDKPLTFAVEGVHYEADLCDKHRAAFLDSVAPYTDLARPVSTRSGSAVRAVLKGKRGVFTTKDVRQWLKEQGRDVSPSGRLPNEFIEEYKAAHGG